MPPERLETAVVLAGGLGTRLGELTARAPKPLMPVKGRPFLEHLLVMLGRHGISEVILLTGYLGEQIEAYFGSGRALDLTIRYSREPAPCGTGGALRLASDLLPAEFFLVYGDSYLDTGYQAAYRAFHAGRLPGASGLMVVTPLEAVPDAVGNVRLGPGGGTVASYEKGRGGDHRFVDAGVLILSREVVGWLPAHGSSALEELVYPRLAREGRLLAFPSGTRFYDIGTPERLAVFERVIA